MQIEQYVHVGDRVQTPSKDLTLHCNKLRYHTYFIERLCIYVQLVLTVDQAPTCLISNVREVISLVAGEDSDW